MARVIPAVGLLLACLAWLPSHAQTMRRTWVERQPTETGIGQQYRATVKQAAQQAKAGDMGAAWATLQPVVAYCDAQLQRVDVRFISVASAGQYNRYMREYPRDDTPVEWLDIACAEAYHYQGYAQFDQKQYALALPYLEKAIALAPYFPEALNERAAALNQLGRLDEAVVTYRQVIALGEHVPESAYMAPLAWRGIGWALVEKQDWAGARQAYEQSLVIDPGNELALSELEYIKQHAPL
jgi:tetratricopeptide (TPR) repeat protein